VHQKQVLRTLSQIFRMNLLISPYRQLKPA
jgi:hypothetical protein